MPHGPSAVGAGVEVCVGVGLEVDVLVCVGIAVGAALNVLDGAGVSHAVGIAGTAVGMDKGAREGARVAVCVMLRVGEGGGSVGQQATSATSAIKAGSRYPVRLTTNDLPPTECPAKPNTVPGTADRQPVLLDCPGTVSSFTGILLPAQSMSWHLL